MFVPKMLNTKGLSYALKLLHAFRHFYFLPVFSNPALNRAEKILKRLLFENLENKNFKCYHNKKHFFAEKHND